MASPGELVAILAEAMGLPKATLAVHDRQLRTAGLRSKNGRGRGAAKVTARDAAMLLISILGGGEIKDAVATVRRYADTRPQGYASKRKPYSGLGLNDLETLPNEHSFIDAVEALIASAATGSLAERLAAEAKRVRGRRIDVAPLIEVTALMPGTLGDIRIAGTADGRTVSVRYGQPSPWDKRRNPSKASLDAWEAKIREHKGTADYERFQRVSARVILRLADAVATGKEHF